jgi:hypothetical protein
MLKTAKAKEAEVLEEAVDEAVDEVAGAGA